MQTKYENNLETKASQKISPVVVGVLKILPREHLRGLDHIRFVKKIKDTRVRSQTLDIPALYHPKQGPRSAWLEIATDILLGPSQPLQKRLILRMSFKSNLATLIISLVGQHYYSTLRHSIKRGQLEHAIRNYTEKYLKLWSCSEHKIRARLFKPLETSLERWARTLGKNVRKTKG